MKNTRIGAVIIGIAVILLLVAAYLIFQPPIQETRVTPTPSGNTQLIGGGNSYRYNPQADAYVEYWEGFGDGYCMNPQTPLSMPNPNPDLCGEGNQDIVLLVIVPTHKPKDTDPTPTAPTITFTETPTTTPSVTPTAPTEVTPTITSTPSATPTEPPTNTPPPTDTPTDEPTLTPEPTDQPTNTPEVTPTDEPKPTHTPKPTHEPKPTKQPCNNGEGNGGEGCSPSDEGNDDEDDEHPGGNDGEHGNPHHSGIPFWMAVLIALLTPLRHAKRPVTWQTYGKRRT